MSDMTPEPDEPGAGGAVTRRMSWNQLVCTDCWVQKNSEETEDGTGLNIRVPVAVRDPDAEWIDRLNTCHYCGRCTTSGIFIRDDPANVPFPRPKED